MRSILLTLIFALNLDPERISRYATSPIINHLF
jgi:hypothetical protein